VVPKNPRLFRSVFSCVREAQALNCTWPICFRFLCRGRLGLIWIFAFGFVYASFCAFCSRLYTTRNDS